MLARLLLSVLSLLAVHGAVLAQAWPAKQPIRVLVTNTAGSAVDITARVVFEHVSRQIGQTVVVENRPGGANTIGIAAVAKAEPDGYTILVTTSSLTITPYTHANLPYDVVRDLRPVIALGNLTNVMITPAGKFKSLRDMVTAAKAKPDALTYASIGPGSTGHLSAERFSQSAGFKGLHVPFKGSPEAVRDIAAGRVDFFFTPVLPGLALIRDGKLDAFVVSSSSRSSILPDVPTTVQAGFPDSGYDFWVGMFVPAATPEPIVNRLYEETRKALQLPQVKDNLAKLGEEPMDLTRAQFEAYVKQELEVNAKLVAAAKITLN